MSYIINIPPIENDELMSSYFRRMATANGFSDPVLFMQAYIWPNSIMNPKQKRSIRDDGFNTLIDVSEMVPVLSGFLWKHHCFQAFAL